MTESRDSALTVVGKAIPDASNLLARIVAAGEELAFGESEQAAAILADLETDLATLVGRAAC
jgi:hypothetical protein